MMKEKNEKADAKRRKRMLKQYAASVAFVGLVTLVQGLSLHLAFSWDVLICTLAGIAALGMYAAGFADLARHGASGRVFTLVRRWMFFVYIAILLITTYC